MIVMAVDLGERRTGVAVSDATGLIAGRARTVEHRSDERLLAQLRDIIACEKPGRVVLGLPLHMNGDEGERAQKARAFGQRLARECAVDVDFWDERGTSVTANRILSDAGKKRGKQRARVDAVAATIILQGYLDAHRQSRGPR